MLLVIVFFSISSICFARFPLRIFESYLERNGVSPGIITREKISRILTDIDEEDGTRKDFSFKLKPRTKQVSVFDVLGTISGVVNWVTVFEKQLADAIWAGHGVAKASNALGHEIEKSKNNKKKSLTNKYNTLVLLHKGDLRKAHASFKKVLFEEARTILPSEAYENYKKRVANVEDEHKDRLELVFSLTEELNKNSGIA